MKDKKPLGVNEGTKVYIENDFRWEGREEFNEMKRWVFEKRRTGINARVDEVGYWIEGKWRKLEGVKEEEKRVVREEEDGRKAEENEREGEGGRFGSLFLI